MLPTATHINYLSLCPRKLWLFANGITMEHTSETVAEGRLIHETAYPQRAERFTELQIDNIKIDYYDPQTRTVHEIKKSDKLEESHIVQVRYYLWVLESYGIESPTGIIEYPRQRRTRDVTLTEDDRRRIEQLVQTAEALPEQACPAVIRKPYCKKCSYYEFCYIAEPD